MAGFDPNEPREHGRWTTGGGGDLPVLAKRVRGWNGAIAILDRSEVQLRDLIERDLVDVAGVNGIRYGEAMAPTDKLMKKVAIIRTRAIKRAFRYLRSK